MYDRVTADRLAFYLIRWRNRVAVERLLSPKRLIGTAGREKHACRRDENDVSHGALLGKQMAGKPRRAGADGASPSGRSLSRIGRRLGGFVTGALKSGNGVRQACLEALRD